MIFLFIKTKKYTLNLNPELVSPKMPIACRAPRQDYLNSNVLYPFILERE